MLLGRTPEEQALVEQWIHFADTEIQPYSGLLNGMFTHKIPYSKQVRGFSSLRYNLAYVNHPSKAAFG